MSTGETTEQERSTDSIRDEVRQTVRQLSELATTEQDFDQFCNAALEQLVAITGAHGAALWQMVPQQGPVITHKAGESPSAQASKIVSPEHAGHSSLVQSVITQQKTVAVDSDSFDLEYDAVDDGESHEQYPPFLLLLAPVLNRQRECHGALELLQRGDVGTAAREGYLRFVSQIAQLFQRWHEQQDLARLSQHADNWSQRMDFISEVHGSIDHKQTAYSIANEARRLLNCDRVSVARWNGRRCKIQAISSQDRFDNRANVVKKLARVATSSVAADMPLWIQGETSSLAPEVAKRINDYLDEAHSRTLAVLPLVAQPTEKADLEMNKRLKPRPKKLGAVVIEYFDQDVAQLQVEDDCSLIVKQSSLALDNARRHGEIFLLPIWKRLGWLQKVLFGDHLAKTITGLVALALLVGMLLFWPAELRMKADGVMQPTDRRTIFAQTDGIVSTVHVNQHDQVEKGELLIELQNPELDLQITDAEGRLLTLDQQIRAVEYQLARARGTREEILELGSSLQLFEERKKNLLDQLQLMELKKSLQKIHAPIGGTIVTWDAKRRLPGLPVTANQPVLAIDNLTGDWQLELKIPQNKIGYVNQAMQEADGQPLDAEFTVDTNPNVRLKGKLVDVASRAQMNEQGVPEFRATVKADIRDLKELRPGAGVTAKIDCGTETLGFTWFYQPIDWIRTNVLF